MKTIFLSLSLLVITSMPLSAQQAVIRISTNETDLILKTAPNGRLYQSYLGAKFLQESDAAILPHYIARPASDGAVTPRGWEVYPCSGAEDFFEPAIAIRHNDGNMTSILRYVSHEVKNNEGGTETIIKLKDDVYPL
ncbi:MAG: alpha-galactosidase, partial [Dysgonamonadaceae bacterium]|nr:alpha-galactosidase [Dysgonamonadaceae bacterium]